MGAFFVCIIIFSILGQLTSAIYTGHVLLYAIMFYIGFIVEDISKKLIVSKKVFLISLAGIFDMLVLRIISRILFDETSIYILVIVITSIIEVILYFAVAYIMFSKLESVPIIRHFDTISYEFYLIHGLFISASTSIVGLLNKNLVEILIIFMASWCFSIALNKITTLLMKNIKRITNS